MANYKVTISNIDIYRKKLTHQETMALIKEYQESSDPKIKEELVIDNTRLVLSMTKRFVQRVDNVDDLFQVGMIGLVKAIDNFDLTYNLRFSTYAVPLIIGEMKRYIRDNSQIKIARSIKDVAYLILQEKDKFLQSHQREATVSELAKKLDLKEKIIVEALSSTNVVASLQEETNFEDGTTSLIDQVENKASDSAIMKQSIDLWQAIKTLTKKEQTVIEQRYFQGNSQMEIANELFLSQAQVSRIEKQALKSLHKLLA
ncbi:sigma-70 family RNA polymerase sigma factor [Tannockella kyphosi]|uniref:sigma-70 family RNA polymerase sigma factor n=1 Tax=Tannockella kyphosi TaxID=2899121 RepID=UPI002012A3A2|nr:sigma-70 family RNA polymerase sigma factor [Tannockella kyphosi]